MNPYIIPFVGLKLGTHEYEFTIDETFFKDFEYSLIKNGDINVIMTLEKHQTMMVLNFDIVGIVEATCDRCLEPFELEIGDENRLIVKFGDEALEETDEIVVLPHGEYELNVAPYIYEFINLLIPYKVVHPDDEDGNSTCNPLALKKLEELKAGNHSEEDKENTDPRWDELKKFFNNN